MSWKATVTKRLREFFLLEGPIARVRRRSAKQAQAIKAYVQRARKTADAARALELECAIGLYRDAAVLLMAAAIIEHDAESSIESLSRAEIWQRWREIPSTTAGQVQALARHESLLSSDQPLAPLPAPSTPECNVLTLEINEAVEVLLAPQETRTIAHLMGSRWARIVVTAGVVVFLLVQGVVSILAPRNLAKRRPVTLSSVHPSAVCGPNDLTNGSVESTYGAHTNSEPNPWVMIDLGSPRRIGRVVVYNRGDGWYDESLPLVLELGDQPGSFTPIDTRQARFSQKQPWVVSGIGRTARYVRVRRNSAGYIALAEIEVFEK